MFHFLAYTLHGTQSRSTHTEDPGRVGDEKRSRDPDDGALGADQKYPCNPDASLSRDPEQAPVCRGRGTHAEDRQL